MQTAGARALRDDDYEDMSREAVLLQWERKIEAAERRTVTITGQPTPARRRPNTVLENQIAQPERLGLWAFLLGLFLMVVAAGTAHA